MPSPEAESLVDARMRVLNIICAALLASVLMYVAIAWFLLARAGLTPSGALNDLGIALYVLAAAAVVPLIVAPVVSKAVLRQAISRVENPASEKILDAYQSSVIIGMAMRESTAIIGLVITLLTGSLTWVTALAAASLLAMLTAWPRREKALALLDNRPQPFA